MDTNKIGKFIAENRKKKNMTQQDLASLLNVGSKTISRWETGRHMPDLSMLIPLSEEIGVSVHELLLGEYIEERELNMKTKQSMETIVTLSEKKKKRDLFYIVSSLILFFLIIYMFTLNPISFKGNIDNYETIIESSEIYTNEVLEVAIQDVSEYFEIVMFNSFLEELHYADSTNEFFKKEYSNIYEKFKNDTNFENMIIITSAFRVSPMGSYDELEKGKLYTRYYWMVGYDGDTHHGVIFHGDESKWKEMDNLILAQ